MVRNKNYIHYRNDVERALRKLDVDLNESFEEIDLVVEDKLKVSESDLALKINQSYKYQ